LGVPNLRLPIFDNPARIECVIFKVDSF